MRRLAHIVRRTLLAAFVIAAAPSRPSAMAQTSPARRPNIVLILVDDAALMDFGAYGGEARTPNIDRLAASGALFTNYHTSPLCSPSRAMILTGVDSHRTGVSTIEEVLPPEQRGRPGYSLHFEPGVATVADRLRAEGYRTLMAGKWHLGHGPSDLPNAHGFDRSLALDASGADNWAQKPYMPYYNEAPWFEDGKPVRLPERFYSSELLVDRLISYIDAEKPGARPYFAYLPFQAVHIPVQAPREYSDHYKGMFDAGWEVLREARWKRAQQLGLVPAGAGLTPLPAGLRAWRSLSPAEQRIYARSMEVYSGMLEAMDAHIGRLIAHIAQRGDLQNTIFIVTSDNGPEPSDPVHAPGMNIWMPLHGYGWQVDTLGEPGSLTYIGTEWAASVSSPGSLYKFYASEGGLRAPFIIAGPGVPAGGRLASSAFVTDVTPTILDLVSAGGPPPGSAAIIGKSLWPVIRATTDRTHAPDETVGFEVSGNSALFKGDFKIVRNMPPVGDGKWRLYDLRSDPGETEDLTLAQADRFKAMLQDYDDYARRMGVLDLPPGYQVQHQIELNGLARQLGYYGWLLAVAGAAIVALIAFLAWLLLRRRARRG